MKIVHPSIDDNSKATDSDKEENNDENDPGTPYDGENMNASSKDKGKDDEDSPQMPYDSENMNAYSNNEENNDEVSPDPSAND